ncbi:MAG: hypothetical protein EF812_04160 [Methanosarcinales archaeon]|nr:MAG: hypothetical protein EF812_04160 [Methanosarcinales archaeon]
MKDLSVEKAAKRVEISKPVAYIWQNRWDEAGCDGLKSKFAGGKSQKALNSTKKTTKKNTEKKTIG